VVPVPGVVRTDEHGATVSGRRIVSNDRLVVVEVPGHEHAVGLPRPGMALVGRVVSLDEASITVDPGRGGMILEIPRGVVSRIETSRRAPVGKRIVVGMGVGFLSGALGGAVLGVAGSDDDDFFTREANAAMGAVALGLAGSLVGGIVGAARAGERWEPIALSGQGPLSLQLAPAPRGVGLSLRCSF
jgi:hypothetical protein